MSTDRELLEAAAKSVGLTIERWCQEDYPVVHDGGATYGWSPLVFDSDALRLAVRLELEVRNFNGKSHAGRQCMFWCTENWFPDGDPCAATRRAIVRAAAVMAGAQENPPSPPDSGAQGAQAGERG